jgi:hypothetical protein
MAAVAVAGEQSRFVCVGTLGAVGGGSRNDGDVGPSPPKLEHH